MTRRSILLLVNPVAGGKPGSGPNLHDDPERLRPDALREALSGRGLEVRLHELAEDDDAGSLARAAADDGCDVVVAGGDGTVSGVATAMIEHPHGTMGILAMGSYNNMARGFGIPVTLDAALDVIGAGETEEMDAGWVVRDGEDGRPFFEAAGVGVDAIGFLAVELAERRGWLRAARSLVRAMRVRKTPMRVVLDGTAYRTGGPAVTVSNGPYHGMGFAVAADADPTDGLFNVAVFHGMSRFDVVRHFLSIARRQERREPRILQYQATRVTVEGIRRALPAHADGVSIGVTPVTFEVRPRSLRVFR
ncbi:MAG: diacylglycerol kinase family protein [Candidatus Limnocylindria bacterium]